jgi:ribose transport system ATP-binding protein
LAFLTEDRHREGLCLEASIAENIGLVSLPKLARRPFGWIDRPALRQRIAGIREEVTLTSTARDGHAVKTLSGGNQQKVVLAKWLLNKPEVFVLDEPTRGIDVGAKCEVYRLINRLAESGAGVLMISSEIEELIGMCDRIQVMSRGEIVRTFDRADFDRELMLRAALRGETGDAGAAGDVD